MVEKFAQLDRFLVAHQEYWRCSPFHDSQVIRERWQHTHPALMTWLDGLSLDQVDRFKCHPSELIEQASGFFLKWRLYSLFFNCQKVKRKI